MEEPIDGGPDRTRVVIDFQSAEGRCWIMCGELDFNCPPIVGDLIRGDIEFAAVRAGKQVIATSRSHDNNDIGAKYFLTICCELGKIATHDMASRFAEALEKLGFRDDGPHARGN